MNAASPRSFGSKAAGTALLVAWLLLLGALGAVLGYVLFLPEPDTAGETAGPAIALTLPAAPDEPPPAPEPEPERTPEPEAASPQAQEAPPQAAEVPPERAAAAPPQTAEAPAAPAKPAETQEAAIPRVPSPEVLPPWRRHAQPFDAPEAPETRPRIAVVLTGLGLSSAATEAAIRRLPGPISLSFTPYSRRLNEWIALARVNGHEVLLDLPMEPTSYPDDDPGPQALLTALTPRQNLERLDWALRRATGFVGVAAVMGSRFLASEEHMTPILEALKTRGLLFLDNRDTDASIAGPLAQKIGVANAVNHRFLDRAQASRVAIDARLVQLERIARSEGFAVAIGQPYPVTIERLADWAAGLEARGFVLAPLSAVAAARLEHRSAVQDASGGAAGVAPALGPKDGEAARGLAQ